MRVLVTIAVVAALLALGIAGAVDAVRGDGRERGHGEAAPALPESRKQTGHAPASAAAAQVLRNGGAFGQLVYTDESCQSVALGLPELERSPVGLSRRCSPELAEGGWMTVSEPEQAILPAACLPRETPAPQGCNDVVLTRRRARDELGVAGAVSIREVAWLGAMRLAAIVHDHDRDLDVLAIFEGGKLIERPALVGARLSGFGISPLRRHFAVRSGTRGIFVLDWEGRFALPGRFRFPLLETRAVAWSPDDAWTALATRSRLYLLETDPSTRDVIELPLAAIGLDWQR